MIKNIQVNHMYQPLGFDMTGCRISFEIHEISSMKVISDKQLILRKSTTKEVVYDSGKQAFNDNYFDVDMAFQSRTNYEITVILTIDGKIESATSSFETGKLNEPFTADWIGHTDKNIQNTLLKKRIYVDQKLATARLYMTGLGVYEVYIDGIKVGDEFLAPGVTAYDQLVQIQAYDVTEYLTAGSHEIQLSLGDGWYKGRYGFDGGTENIYGDQQMMIAELYLTDDNGHEQLIKSDDSWQATSGKISHSAIYYGEDFDDTFEPTNWQPAHVIKHSKEILVDRQSLPLRVKETLSVKEVIQTPAGETVFDFGQNQSGWMNFYNTQPKGTRVTFEAGELLQDGNFYRDNLREARAAFTYVSNGEEKWVRPHFSYFGYRYVRVTGQIKPVKADELTASVIYSDIKQTGAIRTNNQKVNRLFDNILWSQKSNFFDVPTDCPQRDERLGWTGDANIFVNTAAFNMDVFQFFKKYMNDVALEQERFNGMVPMYAPAMGTEEGGAAIWGDAATTIPWRMYQVYGDAGILRQNYTAMVAWIEWITSHTTTPNLWTGTFQFGDWLALDGENPALPTGKTEEDFIASIYYYYSTMIVANTADILHKVSDAEQYHQLAKQILQAIQDEYITPRGRLAIDTQTAYAIALHFNIVPKEFVDRVVKALVDRIHKDDEHLTTGFVGTAFVNQALSENGYHSLAVTLFLQEDYPSWLYAVNMGATTVWERWNSIESDGSMNPEGMNSLNHYSIGAIQEWAYRYLLGIRNETPGFKTFDFAPQFDPHFKEINGYYQTSYGMFKAAYQLESDSYHTVNVKLTIPYGVTVKVQLPRTTEYVVNDEIMQNGTELQCGEYVIKYIPSENYVAHYTADTPVSLIMNDPLMVAKIDEIDSVLDFFKKDPAVINGGLGKMSLRKLEMLLPFINIEPGHLSAIEASLIATPTLNERESVV